MKSFLFCVSAVISLIFIASPASATDLNGATLNADCEEYCIQVEGIWYTGACDVSYTLDFDPALPSGSVTGDFPIPQVPGPFDVTYCANFEDMPCGEYTITGMAELICVDGPPDIPPVSLPATDIVCPCEEGEEGCTPGFWKNHPDCWCSEYQPETLVGNVWIVPEELSRLSDDTLMKALKYGGGKGVKGAAKILLRAATASLLNACNGDVNFPQSVAEVINGVNAALATLDRNEILSLATTLDDLNNYGCPINAQCEGVSPGSPCDSEEEFCSAIEEITLAYDACLAEVPDKITECINDCEDTYPNGSWDLDECLYFCSQTWYWATNDCDNYYEGAVSDLVNLCDRDIWGVECFIMVLP